MYLLVGLGNPGSKYENTFHNSGFAAIDAVADLLHANFSKKSCRAITAETFSGGEKIILAKPQTFMNLSGESVGELLSYYKIPLENLLVFYDDYDLPLGALRVRPHGSAGTHNGMRNIVEKIGSTEFARVRLGINPGEGSEIPIIDYVLSERGRRARELMLPAIDNAAKAAEAFIGGTPAKELGVFNINP